jgi:hypothetical protein
LGGDFSPGGRKTGVGDVLLDEGQDLLLTGSEITHWGTSEL